MRIPAVPLHLLQKVSGLMAPMGERMAARIGRGARRLRRVG